MDPITVLLTLSQFALALAGFTGVVIAFGFRGGEWHPADSFRTFRALASSLSAAFLALVPVAIQLFGVSERATWRWSSAIFVLHSIAWVIIDAPRHWWRREEIRGVVPGWGPVALYGGALVIVVAQALNATGSWFAPSPGVFVVGILIYLALPAVIFARIPFVRPD